MIEVVDQYLIYNQCKIANSFIYTMLLCTKTFDINLSKVFYPEVANNKYKGP